VRVFSAPRFGGALYADRMTTAWRTVLGAAAVLVALGLGCSDSDTMGGGSTSAAAGGTGGAPVAVAGAGGAAAGGTSGTGGSGASAAGVGAGGAPSGGGTAGGGGQSPDTPGQPGVRFVGRVDTSDPASARFAWSGAGVVARFTGNSLAVRLADTLQYSVLVDGVLQTTLTSNGASTPIGGGFGPGEHTVELYRRTEPSTGTSQFLGFDVPDGELLPPPAVPERRLEIIGDSISAGYGNEGADETCGFTPETENHYLTYGALAARELSAELSTVAWSGKGVVCNYGDDATSCTDPMPTYIDRILPDRQDSAWDYARYQPQAVVINLGTNDFSTNDDPTEEQFVPAYVTLLERVRAAYPEALILATVGPLLSGTDLSTARALIASAVEQRLAAGDEAVRSFDLEPQDASNGLGCDYHPNLVTHQIMADVLTATLQLELGW